MGRHPLRHLKYGGDVMRECALELVEEGAKLRPVAQESHLDDKLDRCTGTRQLQAA